MRSFESFKAKRERIDPSARKLSARQWQQAYAAYKRVRGYADEDAPPAVEQDVTVPTGAGARSAGEPVGRVEQLRRTSVYSRERQLVNRLAVVAWIVILGLLLVELLVATPATQIVQETGTEAGGCVRTVRVLDWGAVLTALLTAALAALLVHGRKLLQVLIDVADAAVQDSGAGPKGV